MTKHLIDTNILIDHLRGDLKSTALLRDIETGRIRACISVITESEMLSSPSLTHPQLRAVESLLTLFPKLAVTSRVAQAAARLRRTYRIDLPDALIAATARLANATLVTRNLKHFRHIQEIRLRSL